MTTTITTTTIIIIIIIIIGVGFGIRHCRLTCRIRLWCMIATPLDLDKCSQRVEPTGRRQRGGGWWRQRRWLVWNLRRDG
jgi:hypothetical protein